MMILLEELAQFGPGTLTCVYCRACFANDKTEAQRDEIIGFKSAESVLGATLS